MSERESDMLHRLLDRTSYMIGVVELPDDDSDIFHVYDSPGTFRFFGIPDSVAGRSASERGVSPQIIAEWVRRYRESERLGHEVRFEYEHPSLDGPRWLTSVVAPLGRSDNGRASFSYVTEDRTERKRAQAELQARETHLRLAMEASLCVAFDWDIQQNRVRRLQSTEEALPVTGDGWDTFENVAAVIHPEDRALFEENVQRALSDGSGTYRSEHRVLRKDGTVRWLMENGRVQFDAGGRPVHFIGVSQDVTERHEREEALRQRARLLDVSHDPIMAWSDSRGILEWNAGAERLYGYSHDEAMGRDIHELLQTASPVPLREILETIERDGEWTGELTHCIRDGREIVVESRQQLVTFDGARVVLESNREITERKRTEEALRSSEARWKRLFETNLLGIVFWDMRGGVHDANDEFLRMVGYDREDLAGGRINWAAMTPPEYAEQDARSVDEVKRTGKHAPIEKEFVRKDGRRVWVLAGSAMLEDDRGVAFLMDISVRKAAERALVESEEQARRQRSLAEADRALLDAVLAAAPVAIIVADASGRLLRFNAANELLWGPAPLSSNVDEYREWKGWWADESPRRGQRLRVQDWAMARALRGDTVRGDIVEIEPFGAPDVRRTMVNSGAPVRDSAGHIIGAVVAQMDITNLVAAREELRSSEERFRSIAEALPGLVFVHDSAGANSFVNDGFCALSGRPHQRLLGQNWKEIVHPDDLAAAQAEFDAAVREGKPFQTEYRLRRYDGAWRWFLVRSVPQKDADGVVRRWMGTGIDITERMESEAALRDADRRKDEFISILAHELRNPLAPVRTATEILRRYGSSEPNITRCHEIIDRQITHMSRLIDDLLDVSRISKGKLALTRERCDLRAIARSTAEDYRSTVEANGVQLVVDDERRPVWVDGDCVRLAQIVGNLLNNAGRFTERGGRVEIRTDVDGGAGVVTVADTGVGISAELLAQLFDPFSQAEQDLARTKGGLGLGLALAKGLVELHGGRITARSEGQGRGATFTVRIPLSASDHSSTEQPVLQDGASPSVRVLVVEDNHDAADTLGQLLGLAGYEVEIAYDGPSALETARTFRPQVVISDLGLPGGMDGFAVARALRDTEETRRSVIIALSGYATPETQQRASVAGFNAHLAKPADLARIQAAIADQRG